MVIMMAAIDTLAASGIEDYESRIDKSIETIDSMMAGEEDPGPGVAYIKSQLPVTEEVDSNGQTIKVDNQWLHSLLDQYKIEEDQQKRTEKLEEASGRLIALRMEIERQASSTDDSQAATGEIKDILARAEYQKKVEDPITKFIRETKQKVLDLIQAIWNRAFELLFGQGQQASWLFRAIVIIAIALGLFYAIRMIARTRRGKRRIKSRTILGEEIEEGMTPRDLAQAADDAARVGDFRSAIRKLYISLLYELAERRLIELEPNATNHDYLARLSRFSALDSPFRYLTDRFDYTWYGMYPSSHADYESCLRRYQEAMQRAQSIQEQPA